MNQIKYYDQRGRNWTWKMIRTMSTDEPNPAYYNNHPSFYDSYENRDTVKKIVNDWRRFCQDFKVTEVYNGCPTYKVNGTRCNHLRECSPYCSNDSWFDHPFGIRTESGDYYIVTSNYEDGMKKLERRGFKCRIGKYKGYEYEYKATVLPGYNFYYPDANITTVLWKCEKTKFNEKSCLFFNEIIVHTI